jgi:hypothetical protein
MEFGVIPPSHWSQPDWIDESKAAAERKQMESEGVIYGGEVFASLPLFSSVLWLLPRFSIVRHSSAAANDDDCNGACFRYRNMCRFNSGVRNSIDGELLKL